MTPCATHPALMWNLQMRAWELQQDICYVWKGVLIHVAKGFLSDLATIPWPLVGIPGAARYGNHNRACILHDWIYLMRGRIYDGGDGVQMTRAEADRLLLDVMTEDGVGWQRFPMYWAVRVSPTNWGKFV
jgi:hypothetical protein